MALAKTSIFVPFGGALDSQKAPLSMPNSSLLTCDNVTQERKGEWRRRYGFTQVAGDTVPGGVCPSQVATVGEGPTGQSMIASALTAYLVYDATLGAWQSGALTARASAITRSELAASNDAVVGGLGYASSATEWICAVVRQSAPAAPVILCVTGKVDNPQIDNFSANSVLDLAANVTWIKCASIAGFLCLFWGDTAGNLKVKVRNSSTGIFSSATIKTGIANGFIADVGVYAGSTVTLVFLMAGAAAAYQFIEFDPSTLAHAVDVSIATPARPTFITTIYDATGGAVRYPAHSSAAPDTRVDSITSAGAQVGQYSVEAIQSTKLTGVMNAGSANGAFVYQTTTGQLRRNARTASVVGTPGYLNGQSTASSGTPVNLISVGWAANGDSAWYFLVAEAVQVGTGFLWTPILQSNSFAFGDVATRPVGALAPNGIGSGVSSSLLAQANATASGTFRVGLPVLTAFGRIGGGMHADTVMTSFTHYLRVTGDSGINTGWPAYRNGKPIMCGQSLSTPEGLYLVPMGQFAPPQPVSVAQSAAAGALTLLATYDFVVVFETVTQDGLVWRSQPATPAIITLTGANQTVVVTQAQQQAESLNQLLRIKFYRSQANGSVPQLDKVYYTDGSQNPGSWVFTDTLSDGAINTGEVLYTVGEQPNMCWPPSSHVWIFDDRLWAVNRDYRTEIQYSKSLQAQRQPETTLANVIDLDDQWGDVTGGSSVEGRGVIFKRNAIYFVQGDGLTDAGSGNNYTITRISDDIGALPGTPLVNAGDAIYFVSQRGVHSVDAQGNIRFVGAAIDQWVNQPQVNTPETFYDGIFVPSKNEVRFVTTNYVFVYDRKFPDALPNGGMGLGQWSRWTGLSGMRRCLLVNEQMVLFKTDGTVWREGTAAQTTDQGAAFTGVVRTAWVRYNPAGALVPAPVQAPMRVYDGRVVFTRIAGGGTITASAKLYFNDDDAQVQTFTSQAIAGGTLTDVGEFFPTQQKCTSCSVEVTMPSGDATMRIQGVSLNIGIRKLSEQRRPAGEKWS